MKPEDVAKIGQESFLGEISGLEISGASQKAFLVKSLAKRFQDDAQHMAKIGPRKLSW